MFLACGPTPFVPAVVVEIGIDYYRVGQVVFNSSNPGQDRAVVRCSWESYVAREMEKVGENHFFCEGKSIEAPTIVAPAKHRLILADGLLVDFPVEDVRINGNKLMLYEQEAGVYYLYFWVDRYGNIITT